MNIEPKIDRIISKLFSDPFDKLFFINYLLDSTIESSEFYLSEFDISKSDKNTLNCFIDKKRIEREGWEAVT